MGRPLWSHHPPHVPLFLFLPAPWHYEIGLREEPNSNFKFAIRKRYQADHRWYSRWGSEIWGKRVFSGRAEFSWGWWSVIQLEFNRGWDIDDQKTSSSYSAPWKTSRCICISLVYCVTWSYLSCLWREIWLANDTVNDTEWYLRVFLFRTLNVPNIPTLLHLLRVVMKRMMREIQKRYCVIYI